MRFSAPARDGILDGFAKLFLNSFMFIMTSVSSCFGTIAVSKSMGGVAPKEEVGACELLLSGGSASLGKGRHDSCQNNHSPLNSLMKLSVIVLSSLDKVLCEQRKGQSL